MFRRIDTIELLTGESEDGPLLSSDRAETVWGGGGELEAGVGGGVVVGASVFDGRGRSAPTQSW